MKRLIVMLAIASAAGIAAASAAGFEGSQLTRSACGGGSQVVNVVQFVNDDRDDGVHGNVWASTAYVRHIEVWQQSATTFCAVTHYTGAFKTIVGVDTPGGTSSFTRSVAGILHGGYRTTTFTGTLNPSPAYRTRGFIGTFDYDCNGTFTCPGFVDWKSAYFTSVGGDFDLAWWGWQYAYKNQRWINSSDGNSGDITG
jgi:hypothetical protein